MTLHLANASPTPGRPVRGTDGTPALWRRLLLLVAPVLALLAPVLEAFGTLSIPAFTPASLVLTGGIGIIGLALGSLAALLMPGRHAHAMRQMLFVSVLVVIVLLVLDIAVGGHAVLTAVSSRRIGRLAVLLLAAAVCFALLWAVRQHAASLFGIAALAFFTSTAALNVSAFRTGRTPDPVPVPTAAPTEQPPFVYMLFDGAMGVEGLDVVPGGPALAEELRRLFARHGFRLNGGAFSRHFTSGRSIPNALNFDFRDDSWGPILRYSTDGKVSSRLFERLRDENYDIVVYGTEHLDFCFEGAARCEILPSFNPFNPYLRNERQKSTALYQVVRYAFAESYLVYRYANFLLSRYEGVVPSAFSNVDAYAFSRWFDRMAVDVLTLPRGRAYFAHLLMPHSPYVLDASCRESGRAILPFFLTEEREPEDAEFEEARAAAYADYISQYRCLLTKFEGLLTEIDGDPAFKDATIVIHGDHGARISAGMHAETVSDRDLIDNHAALFAIRGPSIAPGYDRRHTSIQRLTAEYLSGWTDQELGPDNVTVVLDSQQEGSVVVRPMPRFGSAQ